MGNKIKERREDLKMSQEDLATASGISRVTISRLESGAQSDLKVSNLKRLAEILKCDIGDLLF